MTVLDILTDLSSQDEAFADFDVFVASVADGTDDDGPEAVLRSIAGIRISVEESTIGFFTVNALGVDGVDPVAISTAGQLAQWAARLEVDMLDFEVTMADLGRPSTGLIGAVISDEHRQVWLLEPPESQWPHEWFTA